jgi:hypothetical protein
MYNLELCFYVIATTRKTIFHDVGLLFSLAEKCKNRQQTRNEGVGGTDRQRK